MGPVLAVPIPLFDQGQARIGRAVAELRRAQQEYYALAVRIRATARAMQDRIAGAQDRALYYRDILLPLRERIVNEAQLHYNAMQIGSFQLLRDREQQIETGVAYVEALREYWLARADLLHRSRVVGCQRLSERGSAGSVGRSRKRKGTEEEGVTWRRGSLGGRSWALGRAHSPAASRGQRKAMRKSKSAAAVPPNVPAGAGRTGRRATAAGRSMSRRCRRGCPESTTSRSSSRTALALPFKVVDGVKVFHLIVEEVDHAFDSGLRAKCWGYNGRVNSTVIEAVEGERVRIYVTNRLPMATSVHWHGFYLPNGMDGVGGLTQPYIKPGETAKYEWTLRQYGSFMFHAHHDEMTQMGMGLIGMFVVHPRNSVTRVSRGPGLLPHGQRVVGEGGHRPPEHRWR